MKRSSSGLLLSKAIEGFQNFKLAEGLSQRTVDSYLYVLNKWLNYIGDVDIKSVEPSTITEYLTWLRTEYKPVRFNQKKKHTNLRLPSGRSPGFLKIKRVNPTSLEER